MTVPVLAYSVALFDFELFLYGIRRALLAHFRIGH